YLIGNNMANSLRIAANRTNIVKLNDNYRSWASFGANVSALAGNMIGINAVGLFTFGAGNASPGEQHNGPMPSVVEDLSWIKGSPQFGFGGAIYQQPLNYWSGTNAVGTAMFDGSTTGLVLGDFMMGRPLTFNQGTVYVFYTRVLRFAVWARQLEGDSAIVIE